MLSANFSGPGATQRVDYIQMPSTLPRSAGDAPEVYSPDDDDFAYADTEDAASIIQPSISRAATRMTSPTTPAVEKAAAIGAEYPFASLDGTVQPEHAPESGPIQQVWRPSYSPPNSGLPHPWTTGPKEFVVSQSDTQNQKSEAPKGALSSVFGKTRQRRSSSGGTDTLKKLAKALPSLSISTSRLSSISTTSFGALSSSPKKTGPHVPSSPTRHTTYPPDPAQPHAQHHPQPAVETSMHHATDLMALGDGTQTSRPARPEIHRLASTASIRSQRLRRSASDDSLLYNTLSRVSSFGDDARFDQVKNQVNSRFKAIMDSFPDRPTFKLPQVSSKCPCTTATDTVISGTDIR